MNNVQTSKKINANLFLWIGVALTISTVSAYVFGIGMSILHLLIDSDGLSALGYLTLSLPLVLILLIGLGMKKLSSNASIILMLVCSLPMGMSLSFIFFAYTNQSIYETLLASAIMFILMAIVGYASSIDLTKLGPILIMGVIGIITSAGINTFFMSSEAGYIISLIAIIIFTNLTALGFFLHRKSGDNEQKEISSQFD